MCERTEKRGTRMYRMDTGKYKEWVKVYDEWYTFTLVGDTYWTGGTNSEDLNGRGVVEVEA